MDLVYAFILAFVQGVTEWFPISSSGHLTILQKFLGGVDSLDFQVALHFGTLMAVFVYFRKDITFILRDVLGGNWKTQNSKLGFLILIASIPAGLMGFIFMSLFDKLSSSFLILGFGWLITSMALFVGSSSVKQSKNKFTYSKAFAIGLAQMLSLIPGISRSGMTISFGLLFGLNEKESIKFSYLLAIPVILGASLFTFGNEYLPFELLGVTIFCFLVSLVFMNFSFKYVLSDRKNLKWFGFYTLILSVIFIFLGLN